MKHDYEASLKRFENIKSRLGNKGFKAIGVWLFKKKDRIYDLSCADLNQLDRIEKEGLFVV